MTGMMRIDRALPRLMMVGLVALLLISAGSSLSPLASVTPASAQGNLLQDPGFEGPYTGRGRATLNTPVPWSLWLASTPRNFEWQNRDDQVRAFPHNTSPELRTGAASQNLNAPFVTYTAALYQQVTTTPDTNLTASAWGRLKTCNLARDENGNPTADNCGSAVESGAFIRVGIDPNGGTDPNSAAIVWSANITPHDRWEQATVSATALGGTVTMFIYVTQQWPAELNNAWIDDASLGVGGAGGTAPGQPAATLAPTPIPFVPFVVPQGEQPDGSIIHTVQSGDTLSSIAVAYGTTVTALTELNGIRRRAVLQLGQEILVRPAGSAAPADTAAPEATDQAAPPPDTPTDAGAPPAPTLDPNFRG
ncbi:MAG: LysM peptidoglycan-binding domain-containing protein [Chloroflexi bacterium]|nr:LysM peptidoglycan-binding domain-containing protein [Chloroflexota bacterium]